MNVRISVIMPVYNEQDYLKDSIESILNQSFEDFEFIILDDRSTDDSIGIIESYKDSRINFFKSERKGMVYQFNNGIHRASASVIARMDADDIAANNRFDEQFNYFQRHPEVDVVGSNVLYISEKAKVICEKIYPETHNDIEFMMPIESAVCHPAVMIRKKIFDQIGMFDESFGYAADHDLFLKLILNGNQFYNIQKTLLKHRVRVMRKEQDRVGISNELSYQLGVNYLNKIYTLKSPEINVYEYYFRLGLIEYYRGSVTESRNYFLKCISISKKHTLKLIRYLVMSLLGDHLIKKLRETKVLAFISFQLNKYLNIDLHKFKSP